MKKPKMHHMIPTEIRSDVMKLFKESFKKYGDLPATQTDLKVGEMGLVNWACAWNSPRDIGNVVMVIATDGRFCVVNIGKVLEKTSARIAFYRCEDITPERKLVKK